MFITKKHLSPASRFCGVWARRLALPFLDSMAPAQTPINKNGRAKTSQQVCRRSVPARCSGQFARWLDKATGSRGAGRAQIST